MGLTSTHRVEQQLGHYLHAVQRNSWPLLFIILLLTVLNIFYIKDNLGINTDTTDMLSSELSWRKDYIEFKQLFPQFSDNIVIVIESDTPDQTQDAAIELNQYLLNEKTLFPLVFQIENSDFFRQNSLLYLSTEELEELTDKLAAMQPFLAKLQQDQTTRGLFSVLSMALEEKNVEVDMQRIFNAIDKTTSAYLKNQDQRLSWSQLISGREASVDERRAVISVQPTLDYSKLLPGQPAIEALRNIISSNKIESRYGVKVRLTGSATLAYEELDSVSRGAQAGGLIALVAVAVILIVGLGSLSLVFATLVTLIIGLIWTAAFATFAIGELNMISVAFMVLYIGLGVDFAIHYCLRFREQRREVDQQTAVRESGQHIGGSLLLCAFTTAIGFYAFIPTAYSGVAELGLISGTGMFISLFLSLTVLPALLTLLPYQPKQKNTKPNPQANRLLALPNTQPKTIVITAFVLGLLSLVMIPRASFDHNPVHLMDPHTESVQTYQDLLATSSRSPLSINIIQNQNDTLVPQLLALDSVADVISIDSFIPQNQEDKLVLIEDLALMMSLEETPAQKPISDQERLESMRHFADLLKKQQPDQQLNQTLQTLFKQTNADLSRLESNLIVSFPGRLHRLEESLDAGKVSKETLPKDLYDRWHSKNNLNRFEIFAEQDLDDNAMLLNFVEQVRRVAPHATGSPVINLEASRAVIGAFQQAFGFALLVIALLLWLLLERKSDCLLILATLLLSGLLTCAISVLLGIQFNFANIIALPLLLGIGVDSAVHIQHRYRTAIPDNGLLLRTSTARSVLFSALTTACSFGNLAISPHQGTASMGILLTIGLTLTLCVTLIVLPALLTLSDMGAKKS